ncbi:MAG: beta-lactamase family protein [Pirellulales bacterium]|nr:beta-lactamase family protein [Pirellulales bacterium]
MLNRRRRVCVVTCGLLGATGSASAARLLNWLMTIAWFVVVTTIPSAWAQDPPAEPAAGAAPASLQDFDQHVEQLLRPLVEEQIVAALAIGVIDGRAAQAAAENKSLAPSPEDGDASRKARFGGAATRWFFFGHVDDAGPRVPDRHTLFEIGSVSKTFTALLLADMVERGEVALDDPVQKYLPADVPTTSRDGKPITLVQLATHTSGLPRMPTNFTPTDMANPYADYDEQDLYEYFKKARRLREPGGKPAYSNLGMGLLGHVLSLAAGKPYEQLLEERICQPLGMTRTRIALDDALRADLAQAHDGDGAAVKPWDLNVLAGAGGIRSDVEDMLTYTAAQLALVDTPLAKAIALTQERRVDSGAGEGAVALAWHILPDGHTIMHNGQTGGYHSIVALRPDLRLGVVALASTAWQGVDLVGYGLLAMLQGRKPGPLPYRHMATLSGEALDRFVGKYQMTGIPAVMTIRRDGEKLFAQLSGQPEVRVYAASEKELFYRVVEARMEFGAVASEAGADGTAKPESAKPDTESANSGPYAGFVLFQNGQRVPARRVEEEANAAKPD